MVSQALERLVKYPADAEIAGPEDLVIPVEDLEKHAVWPLSSLPEEAGAHAGLRLHHVALGAARGHHAEHFQLGRVAQGGVKCTHHLFQLSWFERTS